MMTPRMGDRDSREEIEKVFKLFDEDNTGYITFRNLKKICNDLGENLSVKQAHATTAALHTLALSLCHPSLTRSSSLWLFVCC